MPDKLQSQKNCFSIFLMERPYYTLNNLLTFCYLINFDVLVFRLFAIVMPTKERKTEMELHPVIVEITSVE